MIVRKIQWSKYTPKISDDEWTSGDDTDTDSDDSHANDLSDAYDSELDLSEGEAAQMIQDMLKKRKNNDTLSRGTSKRKMVSVFQALQHVLKLFMKMFWTYIVPTKSSI